MINKAGGNSGKETVNYRISLPAEAVRMLGVTKENKKVILEYDEEKIIEKYKKELEEIVKDEEIYNSQLSDEEGKLERIKQLKEELKNEIDEITLKIEEMSNIGFESQKEIEMLNSDINVSKTKISNNEENEKRFSYGW